MVQVFFDGGASRILGYGVLESFDALKKKVDEWGMEQNSVFIDCAYRKDEVLSFCAKYQQIALNGISAEEFPYTDPKTGKKVSRLFSQVKKHQTSYGIALQINYSSKRMKDLFCILRDGHGVPYELPRDASEKFRKSLFSEVKVAKHDGFDYKMVSPFNHYYDCCCMLLVGGQKWFKFPTIEVGGD